MKRSSWSIAFYVLLVFSSGVAAGILGQRLVTSRVVSAESSPRTPEQWRARFVAEIRERLALDAAQEGKLNKILDVTRARYNEVRERSRPEMKRIHDEQVDSIREFLNERQKAEYAKFILEKEAEKKARSGS